MTKALYIKLLIGFVILILWVSGCVYYYTNVRATALAEYLVSDRVNFSVPEQIVIDIANRSNSHPIPKTQGKLRILILLFPNYVGEMMAAIRIKEAARNLDIEVALLSTTSFYSPLFQLLNPYIVGVSDNLLTLLNPDLIISMHSRIKPVPGFINFLYLHEDLRVYQEALAKKGIYQRL